jgi:hypothetical protein
MVSPAALSRVTLAAQALALRSAYPKSRPKMSRARLSWSYPLKPSVGSCSYDIRLEAHPYRQAKVIVLSPKLQPDSQGRLPHVYDSGALCLNLARVAVLLRVVAFRRCLARRRSCSGGSARAGGNPASVHRASLRPKGEGRRLLIGLRRVDA